MILRVVKKVRLDLFYVILPSDTGEMYGERE